jgi:hypothetical protein
MDSIATFFEPAPNAFGIRYVDVPRDASSVRRHRLAVAVRRVAIVVVAAAAILVAGIGFSSANEANQGYVIPLDAESGLSDAVSSGVDGAWRPSLVPLR